MKKRNTPPFPQLLNKDIGEKIGVTAQRVSFMLANPDAGQNRERLTAALKLMGLSDEAITKFIDGSTPV